MGQVLPTLVAGTSQLHFDILGMSASSDAFVGYCAGC